MYAYMFMFKKTVFGRDLTDVDSFAIPSIATAVLGFFYATVIHGYYEISKHDRLSKASLISQ